MVFEISLIMPVMNEEENIRTLLRSIGNQSVQPSEILIVDGGSTDKTVKFAEEEAMNLKNCHVIVAPGANIARSRNIAIENAKYEIIACTDAGTTLDKKWLENITKPFGMPLVEVVGGFYKADSNNTLQNVIEEVYYPKPSRIGKDFIPSARSIAFKKSAWKKVGGFPENFAKAEDTLFFMRLLEKGVFISWAPDALVSWAPRPNIAAFFQQNYSYAKYDVIARIFFKRIGYVKQLILSVMLCVVILLPVFFISLWFILLIPVFWLIGGLIFLKKIRSLEVLFYGPLILFSLLTSTFLGMLSGLLSK